MPPTLYSTIFPDTARLLGRRWFKEAGTYNYLVPADFPALPGVAPKWMRALALGVGAQGSEWGGGGAFARSKVIVQVAENLIIQVGTQSTGSTPGDSFVKRNDQWVIVYADRGRGAGPGGLAANSTGDVKRDGKPGAPNIGAGGDPASDDLDYGSLGLHGRGALYGQRGGDPGGGGRLHPLYDEYGNFIAYTATTAGAGLVCLEFFDADPGY